MSARGRLLLAMLLVTAMQDQAEAEERGEDLDGLEDLPDAERLERFRVHVDGCHRCQRGPLSMCAVGRRIAG